MTAAAASLPRRASDRPNDPDALTLSNLQAVLRILQILLTYGRHLADTFDRRSSSPGFHLIARSFGTSRPAIILAHIRRGILRAAALHHVLLRRAATGRDIVMPPLRVRAQSETPRPAPDPDTDPAANPATDPATDPAANPAAQPAGAEPKPARKRAACPAWHDDWLDNVEDPLDRRHLPRFEDLLKEVRRRPIGRTLGDIFADLGIAPALCLASFWNDLFHVTMNYGGSPATYIVHRWRREQHFEAEQDRCPTMDLSWPPLDVSGARQHTIRVLGFFIGEPPVEPALILAPKPPSWVRANAPAAPSAQTTPPEATGPP